MDVSSHLNGVGDGVEERGQSAVADVDIGLDLEALVPHLDGGVVDADPVHALLELEQEALVVVVGGADEALDERARLARAEPAHVHLHLLAVLVQRQHPAPHAVVRREPLQRRPPQRLLVLEPRRRAREHVVAAAPQRALALEARHPVDLAPVHRDALSLMMLP
jgi:hypothetical protein